jgi:redox-sensitive bicupin YhaK (pirin superfamily)
MAQTTLHKADTRGSVDLGWLKSKQSFSFSEYYNPDRIHFGALRVLNDDSVTGGQGFGEHPHDNMEIISIPLQGELEHRDSMNNNAVISAGEIQAMSAGTGIYHAEYNKNSQQPAEFLQIWLFPNQRNVKPRYDQVKLNTADSHNKLQQILSPNPDDEGVWIHQDAWFHKGTFDKDVLTNYTFKKAGDGVYVFVIEGDVEVNGQTLNRRDGYGVWDTDSINIKALSNAEVLLMEVPMTIKK